MIQKLLESKKVGNRIGKGGLNTAEIGVIAAFRRQVLKLRKLLRARGMGNVNVGQVEDFQGQEFKVIVVSTVLARPPFMQRIMQRIAAETATTTATATAEPSSSSSANGRGSAEQQRQQQQAAPTTAFGLMCSPQRFNVALTRAKALAIVMGHPDVLKQDAHWRRFLAHCAERRAWFGMGCREFGIGANGTDATDGTDGDALLEMIASAELLGDGATDQIYPTDLLHAYNDEPETRIIL